ncbi:hypothetical protein [Mesorhizobium neociceri]|uniref:Uncharacterized protein n=1 Tax=Mesorhizobium neociceri TaxID=1307853 RepID=A0A838B6X6_9HYPH|nr:hypothetical protein [Mesorhizobium neociceri]MBA1141731.1 hypothetical protein [Mesorhizobium neociceri]
MTGDFIGVPDKSLVYVGMADREAFDRIGVACDDSTNKRVLTKTVGNFRSDEVTVVFQFWLAASEPKP